MSYGEDSDSTVEFETMRGRDYPTLRQFTVFLENRIGMLLEMLRRFENTPSRIVAMNIIDSTECSIVRFVLTHPEQGREILERAGLAMIEHDLIGVQLPPSPQPLVAVCTALLHAEVNLIQTYPLLVRPEGENTVVALMVDNVELGQHTLVCEGFELVTENDLLDMI
ncbi:MAG: acetolactate synthase [Mariniblastus sp.]|nr:acetolactate synthase [Mariniblastus sp.]